MDKSLMQDIEKYMGSRGAVSETDLIREFGNNESIEESIRIKAALIRLLNKGDVVCTSHEPMSFYSLSSRCLH